MKVFIQKIQPSDLKQKYSLTENKSNTWTRLGSKLEVRDNSITTQENKNQKHAKFSTKNN